MKECKWYRKFDGHYTPDCVDKPELNPDNARCNGDFKTYPDDKPYKQIHKSKWEFRYCPYCGRKINIVEMEG